MSTTTESDLKVVGETTLPGGSYRDLSVMGRLRLEGDVACRSFSCMGEARVAGGLTSQRTSIVGETEAAGPVDAGDLTVVGQMKCLSTLRVRALSCTGKLQVQGRVDALSVKIMGEMNVRGDFNADEFRSVGAFHIDGLLSVDHLRVEPYGPSQAQEIGGGRIEVRRRAGFLGSLPVLGWIREHFFGSLGAKLEAQVIEGDDVHLEDTEARIVRGARITIGCGCRIGTVEYRETFHAEGDAVVGEARQT
jgi:cytoskeletal protein CcmA (bactofilin family)